MNHSTGPSRISWQHRAVRFFVHIYLLDKPKVQHNGILEPYRGFGMGENLHHKFGFRKANTVHSNRGVFGRSLLFLSVISGTELTELEA